MERETDRDRREGWRDTGGRDGETQIETGGRDGERDRKERERETGGRDGESQL